MCCWGGRKQEAETCGERAVPETGWRTVSEANGLTPDERALLAEFRNRLGQGGARVESQYLLRFLRARRWDVAAAQEQFEATQRWRKANDVDRVLRLAPGPRGAEAARALARDPDLSSSGVECFPQLRLLEPRPAEGAWHYFAPAGWFGHDREGRPIYLQHAGIGSARFPAMFEFGGREGIIARYVRCQELQAARMAEASAQFGRPVTKQVVIMDLAHMKYRPDPRSLSIFVELISISSRFYPETLGLYFFVNAPMAFLGIWRIFQRLLDPATVSKMHVLGSNFKDQLLEHIDPSQLPKEYGGTNEFNVLGVSWDRAEQEALVGRCQAAYAARAARGIDIDGVAGGQNGQDPFGVDQSHEIALLEKPAHNMAARFAPRGLLLAAAFFTIACWAAVLLS